MLLGGANWVSKCDRLPDNYPSADRLALRPSTQQVFEPSSAAMKATHTYSRTPLHSFLHTFFQFPSPLFWCLPSAHTIIIHPFSIYRPTGQLCTNTLHLMHPIFLVEAFLTAIQRPECGKNERPRDARDQTGSRNMAVTRFFDSATRTSYST